MKKTIVLAVGLLGMAFLAWGDEAKSLALTGLESFEGETVTVAVIEVMSPHAGGTGQVSKGSVTVPLLDPDNRVNPWTGSGSFTVWVVLGDVAGNKNKKDKTGGLVSGTYKKVSFNTPVVTLPWDGKDPLSEFLLKEFVEHY